VAHRNVAAQSKTDEPGARAPKNKPERTSDWLNWVLVPAAIALALLSFALSWQNRKLAAQLQKQEHLADVYIEAREQTEKLLSVLASPDTLTVKLAGTSEAPNASGVVKHNGRTGTVVCSANLPPLATGKVYQLWLIPVNGAPISAGVFGMSDDGRGRMVTAEVPANTAVKAFTVTIEPAGGVAQPKGPKVLLGAS
jgi:anti-sigma-K factor RskA